MDRWRGDRITVHHRFPSCLGGTRRWPKGNAELIPETPHQLWHHMVFAWRGDWIADDLTRKYPLEGSRIRPVLLWGRRRDPEPIRHKRFRLKQPPNLDAWFELFPPGTDPQTAVDAINAWFLDPRWSFLLVRQEALVLAA